MDQYEATFPIESETDAYAVERPATRMYDSLREESRKVRGNATDSAAMLREFEAICDATRRPTPGRMTVVYEQHDGEFET